MTEEKHSQDTPDSDSAENTQKETERFLEIPDGAKETTLNQPKRKIGEKTVQGIIVGRGDNRRVIRLKDVQKLAELHLSYEAMADYFECKTSTFKDHFRKEVEKARALTKQKLMHAMLTNAIDKHQPTIQIWLSKNLLQFSDNPINNDSTNVLPWLDEATDNSS